MVLGGLSGMGGLSAGGFLHTQTEATSQLHTKYRYTKSTQRQKSQTRTRMERSWPQEAKKAPSPAIARPHTCVDVCV